MKFSITNLKISLLLIVVLIPFSLSHSLVNGEYNVGTKSFRWTDSSRIDPYYSGYRIVNVQVWYPVDVSENNNNCKRSGYYNNIESVWKELPGWSEEDQMLVLNIKTNGLINAPISDQKISFPLLIFSPTLGGNTSLYTYYAEALAQLGFVVAGVNHLYESEFVLNEESKLFISDLSFHDSLKLLEIPSQITAEEYRRVKGVRQKVLAEDMIFTLNKLAEVNSQEFKNKMDLNRVGVWGHSIGGAAAIYASILDDRFKAVIDIDGTPPTLALDGIEVPFMFIEDLPDYKNHDGYMKQYIRRNEFCKNVKGDAYRVLISGADHNSFLDINYYGAESEPDKQEALSVINETLKYITLFFNIYLNKENLDIEELNTNKLEVVKF